MCMTAAVVAAMDKNGPRMRELDGDILEWGLLAPSESNTPTLTASNSRVTLDDVVQLQLNQDVIDDDTTDEERIRCYHAEVEGEHTYAGHPDASSVRSSRRTSSPSQHSLPLRLPAASSHDAKEGGSVAGAIVGDPLFVTPQADSSTGTSISASFYSSSSRITAGTTITTTVTETSSSSLPREFRTLRRANTEPLPRRERERLIQSLTRPPLSGDDVQNNHHRHSHSHRHAHPQGIRHSRLRNELTLLSPTEFASIAPLQQRQQQTNSSSSSGVAVIAVAPNRLHEEVISSPISVTETRDSRSLSFHRRLNEAVQFAEAVGEFPPTNDEETMRIIDTASDSDSDDSSDDTSSTRPNRATQPSSISSLSTTPTKSTPSDSIHDDDNNNINTNGDLRPIITGELVISTQLCPIPAQERPPSLSLEREKTEAVVSVSTVDTPRSDLLRMNPSMFSEQNVFLRQGEQRRDGDAASEKFVYKGIVSNPPEITKRGISRGNYAQLHRKAWLEVSDKYHRYGKNLRMYYTHWESLGHPTNMFFDWLDSKSEAAGQPLPNLPECPRSQLDSDTVLYITNPQIQDQYLLNIVLDNNSGGGARIVDANGYPVRTGTDGWIFVLRDHQFYGGQKDTSITGKSKQRFHHSSFFGGKAVQAAGILITDKDGHLTRLYPHSGHYRPGEAHMQRMLYHLQQCGIELTSFQVDTQQIFHVSRKVGTPKGGHEQQQQQQQQQQQYSKQKQQALDRKTKKVDSLHLLPAVDVACYLAHKALMIGDKVFSQIHKVRRVGATTVTEALDAIDDGGHWGRQRTPSTPSSPSAPAIPSSNGSVSH